MDFTLHSINLPVNDLQSEASFISFLFDVEIKFDRGESFFYLAGARINLVKATSNQKSILPTIELCSMEAGSLENFKQKFELFSYKSGKTPLKSSFNSFGFEFEDPNGNLWRLRSTKQMIAGTNSEPTLM